MTNRSISQLSSKTDIFFPTNGAKQIIEKTKLPSDTSEPQTYVFRKKRKGNDKDSTQQFYQNTNFLHINKQCENKTKRISMTF